jgi:hypothetical protein
MAKVKNIYQKAATLAVRLGGLAMIVVGIVGLLETLFSDWKRGFLEPTDFVFSVIWLLVGIIITERSSSLGALLGSGIE